MQQDILIKTILFCGKRNHGVYPPWVAIKGNRIYPDDFENVEMPIKCLDFKPFI